MEEMEIFTKKEKPDEIEFEMLYEGQDEKEIRMAIELCRLEHFDSSKRTNFVIQLSTQSDVPNGILEVVEELPCVKLKLINRIDETWRSWYNQDIADIAKENIMIVLEITEDAIDDIYPQLRFLYQKGFKQFALEGQYSRELTVQEINELNNQLINIGVFFISELLKGKVLIIDNFKSDQYKIYPKGMEDIDKGYRAKICEELGRHWLNYKLTGIKDIKGNEGVIEQYVRL